MAPVMNFHAYSNAGYPPLSKELLDEHFCCDSCERDFTRREAHAGHPPDRENTGSYSSIASRLVLCPACGWWNNKCPNCGLDNDADDNYCNDCEATLPHDYTVQEVPLEPVRP